MNFLDRLIERHPILQPVLDIALATVIGVSLALVLFYGLSA